MALQVNIALTSTDGGSVATGSYIKLESLFPMEDDLHYFVTFRLWRNKAGYDNGTTSLRVVEIPTYNYTQELTESDFDSLTPLKVHEYAKTFIEQYVGVGNVVVV